MSVRGDGARTRHWPGPRRCFPYTRFGTGPLSIRHLREEHPWSTSSDPFHSHHLESNVMASNSSTRAKASSSKKQSPDLQEILITELQEIHSAEKQLARMIPRLMKSAANETLQEAIEERLGEGEQILADVEAALEQLDSTPGRKKNVAAEGLVNDMKEHMQELQTGPSLDTVLIGALQKTGHYCIAAWGTVKALGEAIGQQDLVGAMERALEEGRTYDERLTELAESQITPELQSMGEEGEESGDDAEALAASLGGAQMRTKGRRPQGTGHRAR